MKKIYFVRHGESDANAGGIIKPENEIELTEVGHGQAEFVGKRAAKLNVEIIIASTLLRARQTAEHIANATGLSIETSDLIIERRYPSSNHGLTRNDEIVKQVAHMLEMRFGDEDANHSDEETFEEIRERADKALTYLLERPEHTVLVVSHSIFLRVLLAVAVFGSQVTRRETGTIVRSFLTKNTGITLLEHDEERSKDAPWIVRTWNDHAHLG
jgi:probable phosphoglycerate mutase